MPAAFQNGLIVKYLLKATQGRTLTFWHSKQILMTKGVKIEAAIAICLVVVFLFCFGFFFGFVKQVIECKNFHTTKYSNCFFFLQLYGSFYDLVVFIFQGLQYTYLTHKIQFYAQPVFKDSHKKSDTFSLFFT